jgi:8-oxo-dGTP pyrophosphatase MutT (NUDIX family)
MNELKTKIEFGLSKKLPGNSAHQLLMKQRKPIQEIKEIALKARISSVLILIYPKYGEPHIVLIQRHDYNGTHSGQIGLPGGKAEKLDKGLLDTALREAFEELQINKKELQVLGSLSPLYIPPSNFIVNPFIAIQETEPSFVPDKYEVKEVLEIPLSYFTTDENLSEQSVLNNNGQKIEVKGYMINGRIIWGATAMILTELRELLKKS